LLRTIGIALLVAWIAESLIQRQWKRAALRAVVALLPILLWQGYVTWVTASDAYKHPAYAYQRAPYQYYNVTYSENMKYLDPYRPELGTATLAQKLKRVVRNRTPIVQTFGAMILWRGLVLAEAPLPGWTVESGYEVMLNSHSWLRRLLNYGVSVFVILGLVGLWRYGERPMTIYLVLSIAIIAATPWPAQFGRYFSPLVPFLAIAFVLGLVWSKRQFGRDEHAGSRRLASPGSRWSLASGSHRHSPPKPLIMPVRTIKRIVATEAQVAVTHTTLMRAALNSRIASFTTTKSGETLMPRSAGSVTTLRQER
jgi:hypothetical protein